MRTETEIVNIEEEEQQTFTTETRTANRDIMLHQPGSKAAAELPLDQHHQGGGGGKPSVEYNDHHLTMYSTSPSHSNVSCPLSPGPKPGELSSSRDILEKENILKLKLKKLKSVPRLSPMKRRSRGPSSQIPGPPTWISESRSSPCTHPPPHTPMCPPSPPGRPWRKKEHCTTSMPAKTLPETKKRILMELLEVLEKE